MKRLDLRSLLDPTKDDRVFEVEVFAVDGDVFSDLSRELAGRGANLEVVA